MNAINDREFHLRVLEFRRDYLNRALLLLGSIIWLVGSAVLLFYSTLPVMAFVFLCEAVILGSFYQGRRTVVGLAETLLATGSLACLFILVHWLREPLLLALFVLAVSLYAGLFGNGVTAVLTLVTVAGELYTIHALFPGMWSGWVVVVIPLATLLAAALSRLRELNFEVILEWAANSTHAAFLHMEEARDHRARLFRGVKDLNDAYRRLERANEMLVEARSEAERARQAQKQFGLTISHELRTPLSFIIGFSEVMVNSPEVYGRRSDWPAGLYDDIQDIYHSSQHLLTLVNDVLDLGKVDANRLLLVKEMLAPGLIVQEAQEIMQEAVTEKGLWLRLEIELNLPEVYIDRTRIRQVLINLMTNSLRFTDQGGITTSVRRHVEGIVFAVSDTGRGISEDEIPRVFEEYGQVNDTVWRKQGGTGLGVPISQRFVEMHGGRIWLESIVGQGTTFFFTIPLPGTVNWPRWLAEPEPETSEYWKFMEKENQASRLLLVLSPDPGSAKVIENLLEEYQVAPAADAAEAARQIERLMPQALIIDQAMQDLPEVARLVENLPYDLPVVGLPIPGRTSAVQALPDGVVDYLPKPVLRENLHQAVQRLRQPVRRLLIVDDDVSMERFVRVALASYTSGDPPEILAAGNGGAALQLFEADGGFLHGALPDAILLDLGLPDLSGWDLLARLRQDFQEAGQALPPVILLTAAVISEELEARRRKTIQISTLHPFAEEDLGAILRELLQVIRPRFMQGRNGRAAPGTPAV